MTNFFSSIIAIIATAIATASQYHYDNLNIGNPGKADIIIEREGYALGYSKIYQQPLWVIYRLTADELVATVKRTNNFKKDPLIDCASESLYAHSGYDKGHLAPAADMSFSLKTLNESFYMSNICPQAPAFNRGIWKKCEEFVRIVAKNEKDIYVISGPIFKSDKKLGTMLIPSHFFKIIYDRTPPEKMIGFIIPNKGTTKSIFAFAVTVDEIEEIVQLDFFSKLANQDELEKTLILEDWTTFH